jgi:hypothetical protein
MDRDGFLAMAKGPMTRLPLAPKSSPQPSATAPVFSATPTLGGEIFCELAKLKMKSRICKF